MDGLPQKQRRIRHVTFIVNPQTGSFQAAQKYAESLHCDNFDRVLKKAFTNQFISSVLCYPFNAKGAFENCIVLQFLVSGAPLMTTIECKTLL